MYVIGMIRCTTLYVLSTVVQIASLFTVQVLCTSMTTYYGRTIYKARGASTSRDIFVLTFTSRQQGMRIGPYGMFSTRYHTTVCRVNAGIDS